MKKVLELGCGHGRNAKYLFSKGYKVLGVDLSEDNIMECKKRYPEIEFKIMNAEKLDLESGIYDAVYAMDILEHVDDIHKTISEISRILKRGGRLYTNVPAEKSEKWLLKIRPTYHKEIHHVRIFKNDELSLLCKNYGLDLIEKRSHGFIQHLELYYMFTRNKKSETQLGIGTWRDDYISMFLHSITILTDPILFQTPLKRFPIWVITLPIGYIVNLIGSLWFPKSVYFEYIKL